MLTIELKVTPSSRPGESIMFTFVLEHIVGWTEELPGMSNDGTKLALHLSDGKQMIVEISKREFERFLVNRGILNLL